MIAGVLAAGASQRFGSCKMLALLDGKPLLEHVIEAIPCDRIIVVVGDFGEEIRDVIKDDRIEWLQNPMPKEGMGSSLRVLGQRLAQKENANLDSLLVTLGDLPHVSTADYRSLMIHFSGKVLFSQFLNTYGPPCILPREQFHRLEETCGDQGLKKIWKSEFDLLRMDNAGKDIDYPRDLESSFSI